MCHSRHDEWKAPDESLWPSQGTTVKCDALSADSYFGSEEATGEEPPLGCAIEFTHRLEMTFESTDSNAVKAFNFVLFEPKGNTWHNNNGKNYAVHFVKEEKGEAASRFEGRVGELVADVIQKEAVYNSWTLMHRYNALAGALKNAQSLDEIAVLFIWKRLSFMRKLDWQRRFNTKPRELQHA